MLCNAEGCDRPAIAKGLCRRDYQRQLRHGSPNIVKVMGERPARPVLERLMERTRPDGDCLLWTGVTNRDGYGQIITGSRTDGTRRTMLTHRAAYEATHGVRLLPSEHVLHSCDTPACVAPAHLAKGDHAANMADMKAKGRGRGGNSAPH